MTCFRKLVLMQVKPLISNLIPGVMNDSFHITGLEINILRQWTTGPPALRIWWPGLKSGGPENYAVILSCIFT